MTIYGLMWNFSMKLNIILITLVSLIIVIKHLRLEKLVMETQFVPVMT